MALSLISRLTEGILTVDPSKAARVTPYTSYPFAGGAEVLVQPSRTEYTGAYAATINVAPSTLTAGTPYWTMQVTGGRRVFIRSVDLVVGWNTAIAVAARSVFEAARFSGNAPTGGVFVPVVRMETQDYPPSLGDVRQSATGVTVAGTQFQPGFANFGTTHVNGGPQQWAMRMPPPASERGRFVLWPSEGLAIRATSIPAAGVWFTGWVTWDEIV